MNPLSRAKPGAATLLTAAVAGQDAPQVVLAYQRYGGGKALAFTVQDSWQWQMNAAIPLDDLTHEGLWRQLLRWLVSEVPGPVRATPAEDRVSPGARWSCAWRCGTRRSCGSTTPASSQR